MSLYFSTRKAFPDIIYAFACLSCPSFSIPSHPAAFPANSSTRPPTPLAAGSEVFCALAAYSNPQISSNIFVSNHKSILARKQTFISSIPA